MKQLITICLAILSFSVGAQVKFEAPYQKNPALPPFNILMLDSSEVFNSEKIPIGSPVILMMFSPDCPHCDQLTDSIIAHMKELKSVRIYMVTPMSLPAIQAFYDKKQLSKYKNIVVGKDYEFFFPKFYNAYEVPFIALYNRNKVLIDVFDQHSGIADLVSAIKQ